MTVWTEISLWVHTDGIAGAGTRVTQVAYFDCGGASRWADYLWGGGVGDFLTYTILTAEGRRPL